MSARKIVADVFRKIAISIAVVFIVLLVITAFVVWRAYDSSRASELGDNDPVLEALAGPEPDGLQGIAKLVNQFSRLDEVAATAARAGYHCDASLPRLRAVPIEPPSRHELICGPGKEAPEPGDTILVVGFDLPRQRPYSLELRKLPGKRWFGGGVDPGGVLASAKGIEFDGPARFADLVLDAYNGGMSCFSPTSCADIHAARAKDGPPRWDGQPREPGPRSQIVQRLGQLGLRCADARFPEGGDVAGAAAPALQRCATRSFAGQAQSVDILIDPMTSAVTGLDFAVAEKTVRMQGKGSIPEQPPGGALLLASTAAGDVLEIALAPDFHYAGSDGLKQFGELSEGSRARIADINFKQVSSILAAPQALAQPQLQRLDAAAALLARLGAAGVEPVLSALADAPLPVAAAGALANCELLEQAADCLAGMAAVRPDIAPHLLSALKEAQEATQGLGESHSARRRLKLLETQLQSIRGTPARRSK